MANRYYRNAGVQNKMFYRPPRWVYRDFSDIPGKEFTIQEGDRMDNVAEQVYGNPNLWKAIMIYNDLGDFYADVPPGTIIKLPLDINRVLARI